MKTMTMLDIETLDTEPAGAAVLSVGFVVLTLDQVIERRYWGLDPRYTPGRRSLDTAQWWEKQDPTVRHDALSGSVMPWDLCTELSEAVATYHSELHWAHPPRFDYGHLRELLHQCGHAFPLPFWQERDLSTLTWLYRRSNANGAENIKALRAKNAGAHNALADAINQAELAQVTLRDLGISDPYDPPR